MDTLTEQRRDLPAATPEPVERGFRTDIQALRAIAVLAVVVNHIWPGHLSGGYVGVDVFFVISGFLISSHLDREIVATARVRLGRFYARRARRLLPAAFLVLAVCLVAAYYLLPYPRWSGTAQEVFASAAYWENWLLAVHSVDYSAADAASSLVQHYWSLSVEEQFYLFWPLLLIALFKLRRRAAQLVGMALVGGASLAYSVYLTAHSPNEAYFVTPVRVWEFALGAIVALAGTRLALPRFMSGYGTLAGLSMIIASAVYYGDRTPFPGYLALVPTLGTALVIVDGNRGERQWHTVLTASRPAQLIGDVSYSLYLWHWPLLLLAPFALGDLLPGGRMTLPYQVGVLVVAVLLAIASKYLVEDTFRTWQAFARHTSLTFAGMIAGLIAISSVAFALTWTYDRHVAQAEYEADRTAAAAVKRPPPCHGAPAMLPAHNCTARFGPAKVVEMGPVNEYYKLVDGCEPTDENKVGSRRTTTVCDFSGGRPDPEIVWLIGDSHAQQWQSPLIDLARERKWVLKLGYLGGCPFARIDFAGYVAPGADPAGERACMDWTSDMADVIADDRPAAVVMTFYARQEIADDGSGRSQTDQYRTGLEEYWRKWTSAGARVVVLADPPLNGAVREVDCVVINPANPRACAVDRKVAQPPDPLVEAARSTDIRDVSLVDLTDYFCDPRRCYAVVGNVAVYYDANHLNREFSRTLKPMLARSLGFR
ncbi:MAG TPA: acyltransferase family protein [Actinophytocola sp.]|uniref:acyltransferase family protein n=1 Tax=Actinophytocola sp. TaxID=1872138 RepID=UPI002F956263